MNDKTAQRLLVAACYGIIVAPTAFIYGQGMRSLRKKKKIQHENLILIAQACVRFDEKMKDPTTTMTDLQKLFEEDGEFLEIMCNRKPY